MTIEQLNSALAHSVKVKANTMMLDNEYSDEYESYRKDAGIYCFSALMSVIKQLTNSDNYKQWMQASASNIAKKETAIENAKKILARVVENVLNDGDDLCDEQSVGWYLGVHVYMHCFAFDSYDFESLFLKYWNEYFSQSFQCAIKNKSSNKCDSFMSCLISGNNNPIPGSVIFDSSDHVRFQNGQDVSGHNYGCHRRILIEKNIEGGEGYTISMYNLDGSHPIWQNNIQMAPKRMRIISVKDNVIQFRGYGFDQMGGSFADYGIMLLVDNNEISRVKLDMYDRNISIVYLK